MKYVIFARVSKKVQEVKNQLHACHEHLKSKKITADIQTFSEPDTSSRIPMAKRAILQEMLKCHRKDDVLVVYKLDRLARHPQELINLYFKITESGVKIESIREPHVDAQNICIYAFLAATERKNIQERTITGLKRKQADMEMTGGVWYGYKLDETKLSTREGAKSFGKPYQMIPDEKEQQALKIMIDLHSNGMTSRQIAQELTNLGYLNRAGNPFQHMTVYRILKRETAKFQAQSHIELACC